MADVYHVNFHTFRSEPILLDEEYARSLDEILSDVIARHQLVTLARAIMPTHVHIVIVTFPDLPRARVVQLLKGASARAFFDRYPEIGAELGGHLWQLSYDWVAVESNQQLANVLAYVGANRAKIGLGRSSNEANGGNGKCRLSRRG